MALSATRATARMLPQPFIQSQDWPVGTGVTIYQGAIVVLSAGYAIPATASAQTYIPIGCAMETVTNAGADGLVKVRVERGCFKWANSVSDAVAQANVGADCYVEDDQTVCKTAGSLSIVGKVIQVDTDGVWVEVGWMTAAA